MNFFLHLTKKVSTSSLSLQEITTKLEYYCSYQERCHKEVLEKLRSFSVSSEEADTIIVHLITENFLNEERFACSFARGKHRIKKWGKKRISQELQFRNITTYNVNKALQEISTEEYYTTFQELAEKHWHSILERNEMKKKKKFCDYLLRKGWESNLIFEKLNELSNNSE